MDIMTERPERSKDAAILWVMLAVFFLIGTGILVYVGLEGQRYLAVEKMGVKVQAEGYKIAEVDDDGDTDFELHIRYTYEGKQYSGIYETFNSKQDAQALIGQFVSIQINPEKPSEQLNDIGSNLRFAGLFGSFFWAMGVVFAFRRKRKCCTEVYGWHREYIQMDLNRKLLEDCGVWLAFLSAGLLYLALWQMFPSAMGDIWILGLGACVIGVLILLNWLSKRHKVREEKYRLSRQTLTNKKSMTAGIPQPMISIIPME